MVDKYAHQRKRRSVFKQVTAYGQIQHIITFSVHLPDVTAELVLAAITPCKVTQYDRLWTPYFHTIGPVEIIDISYIEALVGRVKDQDGVWAIIERDGEFARIRLTDDEEAEEEASATLANHEH